MKYYIALYEKLKDIYESLNSNENDLPLLCPTLKLYSKEELELLKPQNLIKNKDIVGNSYTKKEQTSNELNSIPTSNVFWDVNPQNILSDVYKEILENIKPIGLEDAFVKLDLSDSKVLFDENQKSSTAYKAYLKYLANYEKTLELISAHLSTYESINEEIEKTTWQEKLTILKAKSKLAYAEFEVKGFKDIVEKAINEINKNSELEDYLTLLEATKSLFNILEKTGIDTFAPYHTINFSPSDFMDTDSGWNSLKLEKNELDTLFEKVKDKNKFLPSEILTLEYDEKYITGVELEYSFIHLKRSWFNKEIFNPKFFSYKQEKAISDGETISNAFKLPAYPKTMILIKNLKINIDPNVGSDEVSNINQLIHFGPIIMKNQLFINSHSNVKFIKAIKNKDTLNSNNIKYYNTKASLINPKLETINPSEVNNPISRATTDRISARPIATERVITPKPTTGTVKPLIMSSAIRMNATLFQPALVLTVDNNLTTIVVNIEDSVTKQAVYKSEISIIGINNNFFKEIESDKEGAIDFKLPLGNYKIKIVKDGYKVLEQELKIENKNTLTKEYNLIPESVNYDSYFLVGMICEKLPKITK